jgi:actin-related protein
MVIDQGSNTTKAGLSSLEKPQVHFSTQVGRPNIPGIINGINLAVLFLF